MTLDILDKSPIDNNSDNHDKSTLELKQEQLEYEMKDGGVWRYRRKWDSAIARKDVSSHTAVKGLVDYYTAQLSETLSVWIEESLKKGTGKNILAINDIKDMDTDVLAYLTCKFVFNGIILKENTRVIQSSLGEAVQDEELMNVFYEENKGAYKWVLNEIKNRNIKKQYWKRAFLYKVAKHKGAVLAKWPVEKRLRVGTVLLHHFCESTRLASVQIKRVGVKKHSSLKATPQIMSWVMSQHADKEILRPIQMPMVAPPKPWTTLYDGGYHTIPNTLVKHLGSNKVQKDALESADLSIVLDAVNALDATPFQIDERVLSVLQHVWDTGEAVGKVPSYFEYEIPPRPEGEDRNSEIYTAWRKEARGIYELNNSIKGTKLTVARILETANRFKDEERLFFPNQLDFRGRIYQIPVNLNPQGPDYARALIKFADGKHIEDDVALGWLMVHGANCWGYDKVSLEERIAWVEDNLEMIRGVDADPHEYSNWKEADKPFAFLAWCFDFVGVLDRNEPSYIRVAMDGSCNGIQHFAAMLRDPIAARSVNLAVSKEPQDIYQDVADTVSGYLHNELDPEFKWIADTWLAFGIDRALCKRSVMVMPYGGTRHSTLKYIEEEFSDRLVKSGEKSPFGDSTMKAVGYLSTLVYTATRDVITSGKVIMDWLRGIAKITSKANEHIEWTVPSGFEVRQNYRKSKVKRICTRLSGEGGKVGKKIGQHQIYTPTNTVDSFRSCNSISPNFVHSLDAAALQRTVAEGKKLGITHWHMIHDDYGTHAADTQLLSEVLREQFVKMYEDNNVLEQFRERVLAITPEEYHQCIPPAPELGDFDITEVLKSDFFFA
jgi:DNA-directed RNA polymerase, mitochondrial